MSEQRVGHVTHWYGSLGVAGIHVDEGTLRVGDRIHILGHTSDIEQQVGSMELDHHHIEEAHAGEDIGIKVGEHVRDHDAVYRVEP
ncbi:MAG TPA: translation elongation factor-like protein [Coriobacteriia bacterium]|jgi:putative protease